MFCCKILSWKELKKNGNIVYDPSVHNDLYVCIDLIYDFKGHGYLCGWFNIVNDPQKVSGSLEVTVTHFMTQKSTVTFVVGLTLFMIQKVKGSL